jgi:hypothetical protein
VKKSLVGDSLLLVVSELLVLRYYTSAQLSAEAAPSAPRVAAGLKPPLQPPSAVVGESPDGSHSE